MLHQGLENREYIQLPEGVDIAVTPAGILSRSYAYMIDFLIRALILLVCGIILGSLGNTGQGLLLVVFFTTSWGYNILFEAKSGQTPGKKRLGLRVVKDNGLPASFSQIVVRNLLRPADMLPFGYFLGLIVMLFNGQFKRIGDWSAGTMVIYDNLQVERTPLPQGDSEAPRLSLTTNEQLSILAFAERFNELSAARRQELAAILAHQLDVDETKAEQKLMNLARFYAGAGSHPSEAVSSQSYKGQG